MQGQNIVFYIKKFLEEKRISYNAFYVKIAYSTEMNNFVKIKQDVFKLV
jgi:hypothetical protein